MKYLERLITNWNTAIRPSTTQKTNRIVTPAEDKEHFK